MLAKKIIKSTPLYIFMSIIKALSMVPLKKGYLIINQSIIFNRTKKSLTSEAIFSTIIGSNL